MFKNKGILKYKSTNSKGPMHYITFNNHVYTLTLGTSNKVKDINQTNTLNIAPALLSRSFENTTVEVIKDSNKVKEVFDYMLDNKHTHFKTWSDDLVALQIQ